MTLQKEETAPQFPFSFTFFWYVDILNQLFPTVRFSLGSDFHSVLLLSSGRVVSRDSVRLWREALMGVFLIFREFRSLWVYISGGA
ncbi:MAG: hypothetical protein ACTSRF_14160, partial [Candidatus Freyarchaeota archaeon]